MSDLFDKLTEKGGELVPLGGVKPGADPGFEPGSPFDRYLGRLVPGGPPEDGFARALANAVVGAGLALAGAGALAMLPSGDTIRGSGFYQVGKLTLANLMDGAGRLAGPVAIIGVVLLLLIGLLALSKLRGSLTNAVCVAAPVTGVLFAASSAVPWIVLIGLIVAHLIVYAMIGALVLAFGFAVLAGALTGD